MEATDKYTTAAAAANAFWRVNMVKTRNRLIDTQRSARRRATH